jgi:hypothetical protein
MATATGEYARNFATPEADENPFVDANFTVRSGGTARIASGLLRPNTTTFLAYSGALSYDGGAVEVSAEVNATADDDEVLIGALDENGDGYLLRIRATAVIVLVYTAYAVVDSFGSAAVAFSADDLYSFRVTKGAPNTVAATRNGSAITLSASTHTHPTGALGTLQAIWNLKAEDVGSAAIKSLAVVDGLVVGGGTDTPIDVTAGSLTLTGKEIPFKLTQVGTPGTLTFTGADITLTLTTSGSVDTPIQVTLGQLRFVGKSITLTSSEEPDYPTYYGMFAPDGSINITVNDGGRGLYSQLGGWRIDTVSSGHGMFAPSGCFRGVLDTAGFGLYHPSGALRLSTSDSSAVYNNPGIFAKDGSLRVTIVA